MTSYSAQISKEWFLKRNLVTMKAYLELKDWKVVSKIWKIVKNIELQSMTTIKCHTSIIEFKKKYFGAELNDLIPTTLSSCYYPALNSYNARYIFFF